MDVNKAEVILIRIWRYLTQLRFSWLDFIFVAVVAEIIVAVVRAMHL